MRNAKPADSNGRTSSDSGRKSKGTRIAFAITGSSIASSESQIAQKKSHSTTGRQTLSRTDPPAFSTRCISRLDASRSEKN